MWLYTRPTIPLRFWSKREEVSSVKRMRMKFTMVIIVDWWSSDSRGIKLAKYILFAWKRNDTDRFQMISKWNVKVEIV